MRHHAGNQRRHQAAKAQPLQQPPQQQGDKAGADAECAQRGGQTGGTTGQPAPGVAWVDPQCHQRLHQQRAERIGTDQQSGGLGIKTQLQQVRLERKKHCQYRRNQ